MTENASEYPVPRVEWVRRAAARIRQRDDVMRLTDAADLACALWRRPLLRQMSPEAAVDRALDDDGGSQVLALPGDESAGAWRSDVDA